MSSLDTGILQTLCTCQMGRYEPPGGPEEQVRQHRCSLFMVPVPPHNERLPDEPALLGDTGDYPGRLVLFDALSSKHKKGAAKPPFNHLPIISKIN